MTNKEHVHCMFTWWDNISGVLLIRMKLGAITIRSCYTMKTTRLGLASLEARCMRVSVNFSLLTFQAPEYVCWCNKKHIHRERSGRSERPTPLIIAEVCLEGWACDYVFFIMNPKFFGGGGGEGRCTWQQELMQSGPQGIQGELQESFLL